MSGEPNFQGNSDRLPPQNIEAEEAILGGILLDPEAISRVSDRLVAEAFYISAHKEIYQAALRLHGQSKPTDLLAVISWLTDHDLLTRIGGRNKLATLVDRTVSAVNIDALAQLVMDKYLRRMLIKAGNEIVQLGYQTENELPFVLDQAEQKVFGITQERPESGLVHISDTLINNFQEIEARNQGVSLPGIPSGFYDLDAMTSGFQRSDLIIVAGRPSMGKCLDENSEILLSDGSITTIKDIYHRRQGELLTLGDDWKFHLTQPSAFIDDGIKPVFGVTTHLGRYIETTITHPYLTINGWRQLSELRVGDKIAVPRKIDVFGTETIPDCEVKLLAYLIGDACLTDSIPTCIQNDFTETIIAVLNSVRHKNPTPNPLPACREGAFDVPHVIRKRTIPNIIFKLERSQVSLFLNRLFASNGWATVLTSGQSQLGYSSVSEKLARQIQHLLLRFGIIASLKKCSIQYQETSKQAWQLDINDAQSIKTFISEIGIFGADEALAKVETALNQENCDLIPEEIWEQIATDKCPGIKGKKALSREKLWILATNSENLPLQQLATSDVYWDEIVSIEPMGCKQVYDLTIPVSHNFVANDICVHNTAFCLNIAHNIASLYKLPVAVFSLEMSKEQLAQRLLASEAKIESSYLRTGRLSQTQWEPLSRAIGMLSDMPIFIDDTPNITVTEMRSQARRLQAEQNTQLGLIVIDYLQLMEGGGDNRVQELSKITRSIKGLARELSVPVIALSQLSRGVEARTNKRPMLSDLRESGSIEQDADLVMMLYRDDYYNPDSPDRRIAEVNIAKHRNGPVGTIKLLFDPQFTRFENLAKNSY